MRNAANDEHVRHGAGNLRKRLAGTTPFERAVYLVLGFGLLVAAVGLIRPGRRLLRSADQCVLGQREGPRKKTGTGVDSGETDPWVVRGSEDVGYQREVQVNWWGIMQGLAVGALLTQVSSVIEEVQASRWHVILYVVASALLSVDLWINIVWAGLILRWPIDMIHTLLTFFLGLAACIACLQVTNPIGWYVTIVALLVFALSVLFYNLHTNAWLAFPSQAQKRPRIIIGIYSLLLLGTAGASITLYRYPSRTLEVAWGIFAVLAAVLSLAVEYIQMRFEKQCIGIA